MATPTLAPEILELISEIESPVLRRRYALFYQLPQNLQDKMLSEETSRSVWVITRDKFGLADKDVTAVARVIGLVILGELSVKNFISELASTLKIDTSKASTIAQDINQLIFQPVRESLMAVHGITEETRDKRQETRIATIPPPAPIPIPKVPEPKPVSLEELEKRAPVKTLSPQPQSVEPTPPTTDTTERRRQELIERLKQSKKIDLRSEGEREMGRNGTGGPATTAWNGRTIDLTKIPPRRVSPNNGIKKKGVRYLDPRELYES